MYQLRNAVTQALSLQVVLVDSVVALQQLLLREREKNREKEEKVRMGESTDGGRKEMRYIKRERERVRGI